MKWKNPGHEFDDVYKEIQKKDKFYFFGAGDYGKQFSKIMKDEINIVGFIDNSIQKQKELYCGIKCYSLQEVSSQIGKNVAIIITVSQIQRGSMIAQLEKLGFVRNKDFFIIEEFLSIYYVYKYGKIYFSSVSFLPSTVCNLKCKACLNFNPFAKEFYVRDLSMIKKDINVFFQCVDRIMLFHVSGGEPMLYKHIADVLEYISENYGNRIDTLRTVTNGTVVPPDSLLERLSKCNIEITVDDYRKAVPQYKDNFDKLIQKLEQFGIRYYTNYTDEWIDLAPMTTDFSAWSEEKLTKHFDECCQSWQELRDGKLYSCNYDAYATVAGINDVQDKEIFDLTTYDETMKKKLVEFRLGYNEKGYTNFCKKCMGFSPKNTNVRVPAEQV